MRGELAAGFTLMIAWLEINQLLVGEKRMGKGSVT